MFLTFFFSSQQSRGSEASVVEEDRKQRNFDTLVGCVKEIAGSETTIKIKKPLKKNPKPISMKKAVKAAAEIVHVVCKTLHPQGSQSDIDRLATESLNELKTVINDDPSHALSETLQSIVCHYQNCDTKLIKRALLGEIVKQLKFQQVQHFVDKSITQFE